MIELIKQGIGHILDIQGYDHLLFLMVLISPYQFKHFKKILLLATAFTLGHSVTLAVSSLNLFYIPGHIIEVLIPVTIMLTALYNVFIPSRKKQKPWITYLIVIGFGFIHGMGFSSYFKMIARKDDFLMNLLGFNVGIELGQILIILAILTLNILAKKIPGVTQWYWKYYMNYLGIILSGWMIWERIG